MQPDAARSGESSPKFPSEGPLPPIACGGETVANPTPALVESVLAGDGQRVWMRRFPALIISDQTADGSTIEEKRNASKPEHVGGEKKLRFRGYFSTGCMGALGGGL